MFGPRVFAFSDDIVIKANARPTEAPSIRFVRECTTIPLPRIYSTFYERDQHFLVFERIRGRTLTTLWPHLGFIAKLRIAYILRGYVKQLRRLQGVIPGPFGGSQYATHCEGHVFGTQEPPRAPFESYSDLTAWFNHKLDVSIKFGKASPDTPRFDFDQRWPLVFTHNDLHMGNIMISDDGVVYLIDWELSGFYPEPFELAAIHRNPLSHGIWLWRKLWPVIVGRLTLHNLTATWSQGFYTYR